MYTMREIEISLSFKGPGADSAGIGMSYCDIEPLFWRISAGLQEKTQQREKLNNKALVHTGLASIGFSAGESFSPRARKPQASAIERSIMKHRKGRNEIKVMNGLGILQVIID